MTETRQTRTTGEDDQLFVELRPATRTCWRAYVAPAQLVPWVAGAYPAVRLVAGDQVFVLGFAGSVLALGILAALVWRIVGRFEVTGDEMRRRDLLGGTRSSPRSQVAEALFLPEYRRDVVGRPSGLLVFLDDARRPLLRPGGFWRGRDRLATIAEAAGVPCAGCPTGSLPASSPNVACTSSRGGTATPT